MLKSSTKDEYKLLFDIAMECVIEDPLQASYMEKIFKKPDYHAAYYLHQIKNRNLNMMGSDPAE
jgi:hypothetical protein